MLPQFATALLPLRRNRVREHVGPPETEIAETPRRALLALAAPALDVPITMNSDPSPLSRALESMLEVLERYIVPPLLEPPPPPLLPPATVTLTSVVERAVGVGSRVGTDMRGPFNVAALKGLRVEAVVRYELWRHTPAELGPVIDDLIAHLLGDRDSLRAEGFLKITLKGAGLSENVFSEDAWRQHVEFNTLFEFPYVDSDEAQSLIARIPIDIDGEFNESTLVVDEMARWDNEVAPTMELRGPLSIGALTALAFVPGTAPAGTVTFTRTFDGAVGLPTNHPTLASFVTATSGSDPVERHAAVVFPSLTDFLAALATFKITDEALAGIRAESVPDAIVTALEGIKDQEVSGEDQFVTLLEATIGNVDTQTHKAVILKHAATLKPFELGDWNTDGTPDRYDAVQFRVVPAIDLKVVSDRFEIVFQHPNFNEVAVVYLRAANGPTT